MLFSYIVAKAQIDSTQNIKAVVISGNKFAEHKKYIAQKLDIISAKQISKMNAQTTADVLINSGKVFVQKSQQGGGSPVVRGFEASRILLVVDGVRLNNAIFRAGHLQNIISIDNNILDRMEILYGPASTIHGSDALGGVISMKTKDPVLGLKDKISFNAANALLRYATVNNENSAHVDFSFGNKKFASLSSISYSKFGDIRMGRNAPDSIINLWKKNYNIVNENGVDTFCKNNDPYTQVSSGYNQIDLLQKFIYQQNVQMKHSLNLQYSTSSNIPRYDRLGETDTNGLLTNAKWYYGPQKRGMAVYQFEYKNISRYIDEMMANVSYQALEESRNNRKYKNYGLQMRTENINVIGFNLAGKKSLEKHEITAGIDGQLNDLKSTAIKKNILTNVETKLDTRYPDGKNNMNLLGIFVQHNWKMFDGKLVLNDGLRFNSSNLKSTIIDTSIQFKLPFQNLEQSNKSLTGNIGLIYMPDDNYRATINYSTAFRSPNFDDMAKVFESIKGQRLVVPNVNLNPEKTQNIDISFAYNTNKFHFETWGFYTNFKDAIVSDVFQLNGQDSVLYDGVMTKVYASQNKAKAFLYGGGISLSYNFSKEFSAFGNYNYTYGRIDEDSTLKPLDHIPPAYGTIGIKYDAGKWYQEFYAIYNGKKTLQNYNLTGEDNLAYATPNGLPAWTSINFRTGVFVHPHFQLQGGVENILDKGYRTLASGFSAGGRNFIFAARYIF
ncbi:MAG: TonB-dependent receptor [Chitinophagaceae bacterium]|nr:TonB-dependent receptor [Chitinophagaceae bacterium]